MSNLLIIDAGNTNIVLGLYQNNNLTQRWRIYTDRRRLADEYANIISSLLQKVGLSNIDIHNAAVSSVVPSLTSLLEEMLRSRFKTNPFFISSGNFLNFSIRIDNPHELGADIIAAEAAAVEKYGAPNIVIDLGTATTITAMDKNKVFIGGAIAPGLKISCEALYKHAPHLPHMEFQYPPSAIGSNTIHAMQSGILKGYSYLISGLVHEMKNTVGNNAAVIVTGGLSGVFAKDSSFEKKIDEDLVLKGIKTLYDLNSRTSEIIN